MIYIYHAEGTDLYKVGFTSRNAEVRSEEWKTGCPFPLRLMGTIPGSRRDEKRLHQRLKRQHKWVQHAAGQEWFRLTDDDLDQILGDQPVPQSDKALDLVQEIGTKILKKHLQKVSRRKGLQGVAASIFKKFLR